MTLGPFSQGAELRRTYIGLDWHAVFDMASGELVETSGEAWRWLVVRRSNVTTGELETLHAEAVMPLPGLLRERET